MSNSGRTQYAKAKAAIAGVSVAAIIAASAWFGVRQTASGEPDTGNPGDTAVASAYKSQPAPQDVVVSGRDSDEDEPDDDDDERDDDEDDEDDDEDDDDEDGGQIAGGQAVPQEARESRGS
jgi:hypothetical protein